MRNDFDQNVLWWERLSTKLFLRQLTSGWARISLPRGQCLKAVANFAPLVVPNLISFPSDLHVPSLAIVGYIEETPDVLQEPYRTLARKVRKQRAFLVDASFL
jgi:hypothetical protein